MNNATVSCSRQSLFSAILARIFKKRLRNSPEKGSKIVEKVKMENSNRKDRTMTDENVKPETPKYNGPTEIRTRNGKKGPGSIYVIAATTDDAEKITPEVIKTVEPGVMVFTTPHKPVEIVTADDWMASQAEKIAKAQARKVALAKLTDAERALILGE